MSCLYHATWVENALNLRLYSLETHVFATLTLQMINDSRESRKLSSAAAVWAVIKLPLVSGGAEVLVEGCESVEEAPAKIALVGFSNGVPCLFGCLVASVTRPADQLLGYDAIGIPAPDGLIEFLAAQRCLGASATF